MKINFKRVSRSVFALVMALSMLFTVAVPTIATTVDNMVNDNEKNDIIYVSIGDSMTNGYGLDGYDGESGVVNYANNTYANQFAAWLAGYTGKIEDDQVVFVGPNGTVDHRQLAMSGLRAEDLNWILNLNYNDTDFMDTLYEAWYTEGKSSGWTAGVKDKWFGEWGFDIGDFRTWTDFCDGNYRYADAAAKLLAVYSQLENSPFTSSFATEEDIQKALAGLAQTDKIGWQDAKYFPRNEQESREEFVGSKFLQISTEFYQQSVKDADVISLALGNTNFGTYMLTAIMEVVMYNKVNDFASKYDIEDVYALADYDPEVEEAIRKLVDECSAIIESQLGGIADGDQAKIEAINYIVSYCVLSYIVNYIGVVEKIIELNPDVDIIQVALMNAYATETESGESKTLGDIVNILYTPINAFLAAVPTILQATDSEYYGEADFYYAEADSVKCLVDVFGDDYYKNSETGEYIKYDGLLAGGEKYTVNAKSTVRYRFIENIVGGMTFDMIKNITPVDRDLTVQEVGEYELMTPDQRALYAAQHSQRAKSIALYLAFESATIKAGKGNVSLDSLGALSEDLGSVFGGVIGSLEKNATAYGSLHYLSSAAKVVANVEEAAAAGLTYDLLMDLYTAMVLTQYETEDDKNAGINNTLNAIVATIANRKMNSSSMFDAAKVQSICDNVAAARANYAALGCASADEAELGVYFEVVAGIAGYDKATVKYLYETNNETIVAYVNGLKGIPAGKTNLDAGKNVLVGNMKQLCYLLGLPETMSNDMYADPTLAGIMCMNARILIGTGIGGHPSEEGHDSVYEAIKYSYENEWTSQKQTIENITYYVTEYYDEAYEYGYTYALENGYIDIAIDALAIANTELNRAYAEIDALDLSDELKAELREEIELAQIIIVDIRNMLIDNEIDKLDAEALEALYDLLPNLEAALYNIADIAGVAYADTYAFLAEMWNTTWKPALEQAANEIADAARAFIEKKLDQAQDMIINMIAKLEAKLNEFAGDVKAELLAIIAELKALAAQLGAELDAELDAAMDKLNAALDKLNAFVEKINELNARLEVALAKLEALNAKLRDAFTKLGELNSCLADKLNELAELKAELLAKYEELKNAADDAKQNILDTIAKIEAAIEAVKNDINTIKAAIEAVRAEIEAVKATIESVRAEIKAIRAEIEATVAEIQLCIEALKANIDNAIAQINAAYEKLSALAEKLGDAAADAKATLEAIKSEIESVKGKIESGIKGALNIIETTVNTVNKAIKFIKTTVGDVKNAIEEIKNTIKEIEATIAELKATLDKMSETAKNEVKAAIEALKAVIAGLKGTLEDAKNNLEDLSDAAIKELGVALDKIKAAVELIKTTVEELKAIAEDATVGLKAIEVIVNKIFDSTETIKAYASFMKLVLEFVIESATNGSYTVDEDSFYLAFGDGVAAGDSYVDIFAEVLGVDYENLAETGLTVDKALAAIADNAALIEKADIITVDFSNAAVTEFMFAQMNALLSGGQPADMDWDALLGDDAIYVENAIAALEKTLSDRGLDRNIVGVNPAKLVTVGVESYIYAYTARMALYPVFTDAVAKLAPDALVVVLGTYNDLDGVIFDLEGTEINIGAYLEYTVELSNLKSLFYAMSTENNVIYVDASDVETIFEADLAAGAYDTVTLLTYFTAITNGDLAPSEAGHAYIAEQLVSAIEIEWTEPEDTTPEDTTPEVTTPEDTTPEVTTPETTTPEDTTPVETPVETTPEDTPDETTPEDTPEDTTPIVVPGTTPDDTTEDEIPAGLPVGAIVGISVSAVAVIAAGGFCLYWFVFKKKIG